ncbi:hypothetical protein [Sulfitobacter sp.]|uniref:hypothetical protein n=1 Tax=Sulfitobacter sp. TaxID=1903071 RepID=UPI0030031901
MSAHAPSPPPTLGDILTRLRAHSHAASGERVSEPPSLPTLLAQCRAAQQTLVAPAPSIRAIYHFACTGGTMISKCIGALPNSILLNEMDPLSVDHLQSDPIRFLPTDLIAGLSTGVRNIPQETMIRIFQSGLETLLKDLTTQGRDLVIRCHTHTQFCTAPSPESRTGMPEILGAVAPVRGIVTVRHPLDSFLSLKSNDWTSFAPFTLDEYARRYMLFLDEYEAVPLYRYEDFLEQPHKLMQQMCDVLDLPYWSGFEAARALIQLSGDSGRSGQSIAPRPRREVPDDIDNSRGHAPQYAALCARLDYPV